MDIVCQPLLKLFLEWKRLKSSRGENKPNESWVMLQRLNTKIATISMANFDFFIYEPKTEPEFGLV